MKIIKRKELYKKLKSVGIVKDPSYEDAAVYVLQDKAECNIAIDNVRDADKDWVVNALIDALVELDDSLLIFPRYTYFDSGYERKYFRLAGMASLDDEAIECTKTDYKLIFDLVFIHFLKGGNVGWDLYLTTLDGSILIMVCHHNEFHIDISSKEIGNKFSRLLSNRSVEHELYPEDE